MTLWIDEDGRSPERDDHGQVPVRTAAVTLRVALLGRPLNSLKALTWQLDDGAPQPLPLDGTAGPELSVPLRLGRGVHRLRVAARTPEAADQQFAAELAVRYQPPPPAVKHAAGPPPRSVDSPRYTLNTVVQPGLPGLPVALTIRHLHGQDEISKETLVHPFDRLEPLKLTRSFELRPGPNRLEIVAVNQGALEEFKDAETDPLAVEVFYYQKAEPPAIDLTDVLPDGGPELRIVPGQAVVVQVPRVQVRGRVKAAKEELKEASWSRGGDARSRPITGFVAATQKELPITQAVELEPGTQLVRFRTRTPTSPEAESSVAILYRPPLPTVVVLDPEPGHQVVGDGPTQRLEVRARLTPPAHRHRYEAHILVNGKEYPAEVNEAEQLLTAVVSLRPKENHIQVRLRNAWGAESVSAAVPVAYHRPPRVLGVEGPTRTDRPAAEFVARVRSDLPVRADAVRVEVNGRPRSVRARVAAVPGQDGVWEVRLPDVGLDAAASEGEEQTNDVRVWVGNGEGECRTPGSARVAFRPVQQPPVVRFLQPARDGTVHKARVPVRFRVESRSPLTRIQFARAGGRPVAVDVAGLKPKPGQPVVVEKEEYVDLDPGMNTLRLEAANAGGEQSAELALSFPYRPVRVAVHKVVPLGDDRRPLARDEMKPDLREGGQLVFPKAAPRGLVRLYGEVLWDEADDARLQTASRVRVYVNGFQQAPAELRPPAGTGRARPFEADLLLTQDRDNRVEIALPGLAQDAASRTRFHLACDKPERAQHIHLVLLSARGADLPALREQIRNAFGLDAQLRAAGPAGGRVRRYRELAGAQVAPEMVLGALSRLRKEIQGLTVASPRVSHVVMFYYQGLETVDLQGNLFENRLRCDDLAAVLGDVLGAQIMLLDVTRAPVGPVAAADRVAGWESHYPEARHHTAVLRYARVAQANAPRAVQLINVLEQALPRTPRLAEVAETARKLRDALPEPGKLLVYDEYIAEELKEVRLGEPRP
jgi:hypothetical protein